MLTDTFPRPRLWPTLGWTGVGAFALILAQLLGVVVCILALRIAGAEGLTLHGSLRQIGPVLLGSVVLSTLWTILFVWGLTRIRTRAVAEYLALRWPTARQFGISIAAFLVFMVAQALLSRQLEHSGDVKFMQDLVSSARTANLIPLTVIAILVAAPVGEELAFRGFLYRTLELRFGGVTAVIVTALGWAVLHIQYSLTAISVIFAGGLLFGAIRRYSGSLYTTMLMHALWNGAALAGAFLLAPKG